MILYVPIANELVGNPAIERFIFQIAPAPAAELYCIIILILSAHLVIITIALSVFVLFMLNNKNRRFQANFGNNCCDKDDDAKEVTP